LRGGFARAYAPRTGYRQGHCSNILRNQLLLPLRDEAVIEQREQRSAERRACVLRVAYANGTANEQKK